MMLLFLWKVDGDGMEIGKSTLAGLIVVRGSSPLLHSYETQQSDYLPPAGPLV